MGDVQPVKVLGADGYPYGFYITTEGENQSYHLPTRHWMPREQRPPRLGPPLNTRLKPVLTLRQRGIGGADAMMARGKCTRCLDTRQ
jgi:hypothetical protein